MVRKSILCGLLSAMFLPACINAAEQRPDKPVILVAKIPVVPEGFVGFIQKIVGPNFEIKSKRYNDIYPSDLDGVKYVLVCGTLGQDELIIISRLLDEKKIKHANLALILFRWDESPDLRIDSSVSKLFNDRIFQLKMRAGLIFLENDRSNSFKQWFQREILSEQPLAPSLPGSGRTEASLRQRIDQFALDLGKVNQEVLRLNRELPELVRLTQPR